MNYARRISDAITAPLVKPTHGPERRSMPWWSVFKLTFWFAPAVASWPGISLTRVVILAAVAYLWHSQEAGHTVNTPSVILWFGLLIGSMAKNSRDLQLGFGSILGRRSDVGKAADESRDAAQNVVDKVEEANA